MVTPIEQIVTLPEELPEVCAHLAAAGRFGFDTEFVGEDTYQPKLCLVQAATAERQILIDPFTVGPLDAFWQLIVDAGVQVIVHAGREEIRLCKLWTGERPRNLFDLQIAAGLSGFVYPLGHAALVSQLLGVSLTKSETLTEWRDRPLTDQQLRYAFDDVRYLLPLADELTKRLEGRGRLAWAHEEFERLGVAASEEEPAVEKWRRLRGLGSLHRRQLAVVRELYQWRDAAAIRANRPPRTICRDDLLIEIARRNPTRERDLQVIRGLNRHDWKGLLAAVGRGRSLPWEACPEVVEREQDPQQVTLLTNLLQAVVAHLCGELRIAPGLICAAQDLRLLARRTVLGDTHEAPSVLNQGWRREHIRPVLDMVLCGERSLRVARPQDEAPLDFLPLPPGS